MAFFVCGNKKRCHYIWQVTSSAVFCELHAGHAQGVSAREVYDFFFLSETQLEFIFVHVEIEGRQRMKDTVMS